MQSQLRELWQAEERGEVEVYFYDESTFSLVPYIPYAWQEKGKAIRVLSDSKGRKLILLVFSNETILFIPIS